MPEIFSNTTLTVNQLIEKIDTGELGLPELQRPFIWKDSKAVSYTHLTLPTT